MALAGPAFCTGLQCRRNRGAGGAIASQIFAGLEVNPSLLQFMYSEKATKFEEISILVLKLLSNYVMSKIRRRVLLPSQKPLTLRKLKGNLVKTDYYKKSNACLDK